MKSAFMKRAFRLAMALLLASVPLAASAQDPQTSPTPLEEMARQRAAREAKKAAEQEERTLRARAEKERKEAAALAKEREKVTARLAEMERISQPAAAERPAPSSETVTPEQERIQNEEKARAEAERARKKEEDRARAQEAKDADRRRKDEERAEREAARARANEDKARAEALKKEQEEADKAARRDRAAGGLSPQTAPPRGESAVPLSKDEEKRRKDLVKQIEKARAERDRLNREAEQAEGLARAARTAASEGQRTYEALTTGLDVEDVALPGPLPADVAQKKNRFVTKADEKLAAAPRNTQVADPLRIALELKNPDPEEREKAAFALASLGPDAQPATRALMAALADGSAAVRVAAAQALGRIGTGAVAALAPLSAALTDPDPAVKNAAQAALLAIQGR